MELDYVDPRPRYRLCGAGFGLIALALGLLCGAKVALLAMLFGARGEVTALFNHPAWFWLVDVPITWGSLLGSYILWGRWSAPSWRRRAGLLLLMNAMDAGMWVIDHADRLGLEWTGRDYSWTFLVAAGALGWFELMLAASLAADLGAHLGRDDAPESGQAAQTLGLVGAVVWGLLALTQTDWGTWPLAARLTPEFHVLLLIATVLMIVLTFQVTVLSLTVSRLCGAYVRALDRREWDDAALKSRSETEGDEILFRD